MNHSETELMEAVADIARLAGNAALRHFRTGLQVEFKTDGSEVTAADRSTEQMARDWITARYPEDSIVGEEMPSRILPSERRWFVDPIDGTRSFVRGVPLWGTMIAVEQGGVMTAGAIHCPAVGDLVVAARGLGCWLNGARASVSSVASVADATILCTDDRFRAHPEREGLWRHLATQSAIVRTWGDCYGYILVATGRAELMVDDRLSPWDMAALLPIISEAGGVLTDWSGQVNRVGQDAVASNAALAVTVRNALGIAHRV